MEDSSKKSRSSSTTQAPKKETKKIKKKSKKEENEKKSFEKDDKSDKKNKNDRPERIHRRATVTSLVSKKLELPKPNKSKLASSESYETDTPKTERKSPLTNEFTNIDDQETGTLKKSSSSYEIEQLGEQKKLEVLSHESNALSYSTRSAIKDRNIFASLKRRNIKEKELSTPYVQPPSSVLPKKKRPNTMSPEQIARVMDELQGFGDQSGVFDMSSFEGDFMNSSGSFKPKNEVKDKKKKGEGEKSKLGSSRFLSLINHTTKTRSSTNELRGSPTTLIETSPRPIVKQRASTVSVSPDIPQINKVSATDEDRIPLDESAHDEENDQEEDDDSWDRISMVQDPYVKEFLKELEDIDNLDLEVRRSLTAIPSSSSFRPRRSTVHTAPEFLEKPLQKYSQPPNLESSKKKKKKSDTTTKTTTTITTSTITTSASISLPISSTTKDSSSPVLNSSDSSRSSLSFKSIESEPVSPRPPGHDSQNVASMDSLSQLVSSFDLSNLDLLKSKGDEGFYSSVQQTSENIDSSSPRNSREFDDLTTLKGLISSTTNFDLDLGFDLDGTTTSNDDLIDSRELNFSSNTPEVSQTLETSSRQYETPYIACEVDVYTERLRSISESTSLTTAAKLFHLDQLLLELTNKNLTQENPLYQIYAQVLTTISSLLESYISQFFLPELHMCISSSSLLGPLSSSKVLDPSIISSLSEFHNKLTKVFERK